MAITQLNTAAFNYEMMLNVINKSYKGKSDITLSAYDTTAAPDVKVGSVFEDNGAIFIVDTSDITPGGYAGITNSTTFYLYYDESASVFIYSNTAPTWSDVLQGWYNSDDRAFFSMFKDSGGTLYSNKVKLSNNGDISLRTKIIEIGDWDMDATTTINVAHGITDYTKIRSISVLIRNDVANGSELYGFENQDSGAAEVTLHYIRCSSTNIVLYRDVDGYFDSANFDDTSYNRGFITIVYEG